MPSNEEHARNVAWEKYQDAIKNKADSEDIAILKSAYDATEEKLTQTRSGQKSPSIHW